MTVAEKIYAYLRGAKKLNPQARVSDFQMRVRKDAVEIVNLKTNEIKVFPAGDKDRDWF